jgi:hypothetical protein
MMKPTSDQPPPKPLMFYKRNLARKQLTKLFRPCWKHCDSLEKDPDLRFKLQALTEVMEVRASTVFPVLLPTLTAIPMTVFNARALASLVTVAGNALSRRLSVILNSLVKVSEDEIDDELRSAVDEAVNALFSSINDPEGLNTLMMLLIGWSKHDTPRRRVSACNFL